MVFQLCFVLKNLNTVTYQLSLLLISIFDNYIRYTDTCVWTTFDFYSAHEWRLKALQQTYNHYSYKQW